MIGHIGGVIAVSILAVAVMERSPEWAKLMTVVFLVLAVGSMVGPAMLRLAGFA